MKTLDRKLKKKGTRKFERKKEENSCFKKCKTWGNGVAKGQSIYTWYSCGLVV